MEHIFSLSIIIPHFETPDLLEKLLKSIPNLNDIQIIVIDDNSTIKTIDSSFKKLFNHVKFLTNTSTRKGAGASRNIGLDAALGKWVLFADSDDYFMEKFYFEVSKYFNSDCDIIYFMTDSIYLETGLGASRHITYAKRTSDFINKPCKKTELILRYRHISPCSKMIRRSVITNNNIRFDEVLTSDDVLFCAKAGFFADKIFASPSCIYMITSSLSSLTSNQSEKHFDIRLSVYINYYNYLKNILDTKSFKILQLSASIFIFDSFRYGISKTIETIKILKSFKIKLIRINVENILFYFKLKMNKSK